MDQGKAIKAIASDREIEIELEMVSAKTTRIRTVAKQGLFFKDRAPRRRLSCRPKRLWV